MNRWIFVCLMMLAFAVFTSFAASPAREQKAQWAASLRGRQLEAADLHRLIDDAKAKGQSLHSEWTTRLNELEPLHPEAVPLLPPQPSRIEPAPVRIENLFSPLEQQIRELEVQLFSASPHSTDQRPMTLELKAQLQALYAQRPENQRNSLDQGGDNCANVTVGTINSYYVDFGTTTGRANDFTACGNNSAPDVIYQITPTWSGMHAFNLCTFNYYDARLELRVGGGCPGTVQLNCNDDYCGLQPYFEENLTAGVPYYVIVDGDGTASGQYDLFIREMRSDTCHVECGAALVQECPEDEGLINFGAHDCDGGCYNVAWGRLAQYGSIIPGESVCGRTFDYEDSTHSGYWRDSDWYRFNIFEPCTVRWTASGEIGTYANIVGGGCPYNALSEAYAPPCHPATAQAILGAGSYNAVIWPDFSQSSPPKKYSASLTISPTAIHIAGQFVAPGAFSGTTCGAPSQCSYRPSSDNTIQITVPRYATWRFSLCNSATAWDSYIYLSNTTCGTAVAFNDDACNFLSQFDACLYPGVYYLTIEAYSSGDCGAYTLTVTDIQGACCTGDASNPQCQDGLNSCQCAALGGTWVEGANCGNPQLCPLHPPCQDDASYGQLPYIASEAWDGYRSDENSPNRIFDNFANIPNSISSVRFWGFGSDNSGSVPCVEQPQNFAVSFYNDSSGWPMRSVPAAEYSLSITGAFVGTYVLNGVNFSVYQYDAALPVPVNLPSGWLSVYGKAAGGTANCSFWWLLSPYGDGSCRSLFANGSGAVLPGNVSFCLAGQAPCAATLNPPQLLTCHTVDLGGQPHIQLNWWVPNAGAYEVWSTANPNNDRTPNGGLDTMWHREAREVISNLSGLQTWTDPNAIVTTYRNYVVMQVCRPPNDNCADAIAVSNGLTNFNNISATTDGPPPNCAAIGSDVWFAYTATCTGTVNINTCIGGLLFDTVIEVFGGPCGNLGTALACNDDFCGTHSQVTFSSVAGHTYLIRAGGYNASQNSGILSISCP